MRMYRIRSAIYSRVYFGELYGLLMGLKLVVEDKSNQKVLMFTDNQAAITSSEQPELQSGQKLALRHCITNWNSFTSTRILLDPSSLWIPRQRISRYSMKSNRTVFYSIAHTTEPSIRWNILKADKMEHPESRGNQDAWNLDQMEHLESRGNQDAWKLNNLRFLVWERWSAERKTPSHTRSNLDQMDYFKSRGN